MWKMGWGQGLAENSYHTARQQHRHRRAVRARRVANAWRGEKIRAIGIVVLHQGVPEPRNALRGALAFGDAAQAAFLQIAAGCFWETTKAIFNDSLITTER
jgi:hypothetical protein